MKIFEIITLSVMKIIQITLVLAAPVKCKLCFLIIHYWLSSCQITFNRQDNDTNVQVFHCNT